MPRLLACRIFYPNSLRLLKILAVPLNSYFFPKLSDSWNPVGIMVWFVSILSNTERKSDTTGMFQE